MRWIALGLGIALAGLTLREAASKGSADLPVPPAPVGLSVNIPGEFAHFALRMHGSVALHGEDALESLRAALRLASLDPTGSVSAPRRMPAAPAPEPFGLPAFRAPEGRLWEKWRAVEEQMLAEARVLLRCRSAPAQCPAPARRLLEIADAARAFGGRARIGQVNRAINLSIRPVSDWAQFGEGDVWTSPLATFASERGDCEDYAIAKLLALREAGIAGEDLRLVIVEDTVAREDHAVLAARLDGRWLILDNRHHTLADAAEIRHLRPLYALDEDGVRRFASIYAQRTAPAAGGAKAAPSSQALPQGTPR
jgi:predicted transglutaminase-like cysteine proteinase